MQVGRRLLFRVWHFLSRNEAVEEVYRGPAGPSGTQRDSTGATETDNRGKGGGGGTENFAAAAKLPFRVFIFGSRFLLLFRF